MNWRRALLVVVALAAVTAAVYAPVRHFDFVELDDPAYVFENANVTRGLTLDGVRWAFTTGHAANWHPLTWLSHMLDVQLFGVAAGPHHVVNVVLHILNAILLFLLLRAMTAPGPRHPAPGTEHQASDAELWAAAFVAAMFALHPLHVESVAWISERKDVLSTFFWLLTTLAYVWYVKVRSAECEVRSAERGVRSATTDAQADSGLLGRHASTALSAGTGRPLRKSHVAYFLVVLLFALGLMAKPMLVTLPFVLLLLDFWPLGRVNLPGVDSVRGAACGVRGALRSAPRAARKARRTSSIAPRTSRVARRTSLVTALRPLVVEKLPLFALAAASSVITVVVQQRAGAVSNLQATPLGLRLGNALLSSVAYLASAVWPAGLTILYPLPDTLPVWPVVGAAAVLSAITFAALRLARRAPFLLVGWLWYLGTLVPVSGLVQVGVQARADRYTYVPLVGIFIMIAWGVPALVSRRPALRAALPLAAAAAVVACALVTVAQVGSWKNNVTLWTRATMLTLQLDEYQAHMSLGTTLGNQGRLDEATRHFAEAVRLQPNAADARASLGLALAKQGKVSEARRALEEAARLDPRNETTRRMLDALRNKSR
jgi:protein O-mannosyl-transferase